MEHKKNPISDGSQSSVKSTTPIEVKKIDKKIIFDIKEKSKVAVDKEKCDLQEAEGIIIYLDIFFMFIDPRMFVESESRNVKKKKKIDFIMSYIIIRQK